MKISGWGRFPSVEGESIPARSVGAATAALQDGPLIPRGLGRSYGDSSLGARMLDMTGLDNFVSFDEETGVLTAQAGASLAAVLSAFLPRGWFLPVTPGTRFVTVGGAIASDVHGKNHHREGSFSDHVESMRVLLGTGEVVNVSRTEHAELFHATCGGMGLTGVILEATFRLRRVSSRNVDETVVKAPDLAAALAAFDECSGATYSVGWIDLVATGRSLGRSLVMAGEHADDGDLTTTGSAPRASVPFSLPSGLLNRATVAAFNALYYARVRQPLLHHTVGYEPFFYPLDAIGDWNKVYGGQGFFQYQFAIPFESGAEALTDVVRRIAASGLASPLAVLKVFGDGNDNHLSFPIAGYTLALDFKATPQALRVAEDLDRLVLAAGGRLYLTKDSRMSAETFAAMYPRIAEFEKVRESYGATGVFTSEQSRRLGLA